MGSQNKINRYLLQDDSTKVLVCYTKAANEKDKIDKECLLVNERGGLIHCMVVKTSMK